jgi:hypothetical protein
MRRGVRPPPRGALAEDGTLEQFSLQRRHVPPGTPWSSGRTHVRARKRPLRVYRLSAVCQQTVENVVAGACNRRYLQLRRGRQAQAAVARRAGVVTELRRARLDAVRIPVTREVLQTHVAGLPAGVALGPGLIEVRFTSVQEALQQLFTLAQAITNDYDRFAVIVGRRPGEGVGESRS